MGHLLEKGPSWTTTGIRAALVCIAVLWSAAVGTAQTSTDYLLQTGAPSFTTLEPVELGFVNASNGNLHLEIRVLPTRERGSQAYIAHFIYDSRIWEASAGGWHPDNVTGGPGWIFVMAPWGGGPVTYDKVLHTCGLGSTWYSYQNYRWRDAYGTWHAPFPLYFETSNSCHTAASPTTSGYSLDASGFYMTSNPSTGAITQVVARDGSQMYPKAQDSNGNYFTPDSIGDVVDTLNRTPATYLANGTGGCTASYCLNLLTPQGTAQIKVTNTTVYVHTALGTFTEYKGHFSAPASILLPDGTEYQFAYDTGTSDTDPAIHYGLLTSLILPATGQITYTYANFTDANSHANQWVKTRTAGSGTWTYAPATCGSGCQNMTVTRPSNDQTLYTFTFQGSTPWRSSASYYTGSSSSGTLLMTVQDTFTSQSASADFGSSAYTELTKSTVTIPVPGGNLIKQNAYAYDTYTYSYRGTSYTGSRGKLMNKSEYAFGNAAVGGLARKTVFTYLDDSNSAYRNANIVDRVTDVQVQNSVGSKVAETSITYDSTALTSVTGMTHHDDTNYGTGQTTRGNPTLVQRWVSGSTYLKTTLYYDTTGQVTKVTDPNGNSGTLGYGTTTSCTTSFSNAYPTVITNALGQATNNCYDFNTGLVTSITDPNSKTTSFSYDDMNRLTQTSLPDGGCAQTTYSSTTLWDLYSCLTSTTKRHDQIDLDGLGRVTNNDLVSDPQGATTVTKAYDSTGRVLSVTNPYRSTSDPTYGLESYSYDGLNRITTASSSDGNTVETRYGAAVTSIAGAAASQLCASTTYGLGYPTLVNDQAGRKHEVWTDGLGRIMEADEADSNNNLTVGTCYTYGLLGNLTGVTPIQGSQTRTYVYDGLSRPTTATTPESGTTNFYYTNASGGLCSGAPNALCRRTDARGITTTYTYDALNRLTSKTYSDSTPAANFYYDEASVTVGGKAYTLTNTKGRPSHTSAASGTAMTVHSYDSVGRMQDLWQCTPFNCSTSSIWNMHYTYDLAGDITSWTHPGGFTVSNTISTAQRITQISSSLNDSTHPPVLATLTYAPIGAISTLVNGCVGTGCVNIQETYDYNNRLQPVRIQLGTSTTPNAKSCLVYNYYESLVSPTTCAIPAQGKWNNGNVDGYFFQDSANPSLGHTATYTHDTMNRLGTAVATGSSTQNLTFSYGPYGNMTCQTNGSTNGPCPNWSFDLTTNRINISGFIYDPAGNMTQDGGTTPFQTYKWDAEGRVTQISQGSTVVANYTYNALGQRVESSLGTSYMENLYDGQGNPLATNNRTFWDEDFFTPLGTRQCVKYSDAVTYFLHPNALGSIGMITDQTGALKQDALYRPWGQFWAVAGALKDQRFAGMQERDGQTVLDPTPFRMYSSGDGRWLTPDPVAGDITNPQSLNRYAYALNNPATLIDPSGLHSCGPGALKPFCSPALLQSLGLGGSGQVTCLLNSAVASCNDVAGLIQAGVAAQCPNNFCSGFAPVGNGQIAFVQFGTLANGSWGYNVVTQPIPDPSLPASQVYSPFAKLGQYLVGFDPTQQYTVRYQVRGTTYNIQVIGIDANGNEYVLPLDTAAASADASFYGTGHGGNTSYYIGGMFDPLHVVNVVIPYAAAVPGGEGHIDPASPFGIGLPLHGIEWGLAQILPNGQPGTVTCSVVGGCH